MASAQVIDMPIGDLEAHAADGVDPTPAPAQESIEDLAGLLSQQVLTQNKKWRRVVAA